MQEIVLSERKDQAVVSSRLIAEHFSKQHKDVLRDVRNLMAQNCATKNMFMKSSYESRGKWYPEFAINRDGFTLLAMGFTGEKALEWKLTYIKAFNKMETLIKERLSTDWLLTRNKGKLVRRCETDAIAELIEHSEKQGSLNMRRQAYSNYSKLVNSLVGIQKGQRDKAPFKILSTVMFLEDIFQQTIWEEIRKETHYKEIYQVCKRKGQQFVELAYIVPKQLSA